MLRKVAWPLLLLTCPLLVWGQTNPKAPKGFDIPANTLSPDGRYGVTVPLLADNPSTGDEAHDRKLDDLRNSLVEVQTGRVLAVIQAGVVGWNRMGHGGILPTRWSRSGSVAVWKVDGKWSDVTLVVLRLRGGQVEWQTNVLKAAQQAILERTKRASPKKYAKVLKTNVGMGTLRADELGEVDDPRSVYPQGFTIQVDVVGSISSFPLRVTTELTSEAKPGTELYDYLTSHLTGLLDEKGKLTVTDFHLGLAPHGNFSEE